MKVFRTLVIVMLVLLVAVQFVPVDREVPRLDVASDFLAITVPPGEIGTLIKASCYDCHSYNTEYPWYARVAPLSWWIQGHVNNGREGLNFAEWGNYDADKRQHKLEECAEEIEEGHMPLSSYLYLHADARLDSTQQTMLVGWFEEMATR